MLWNSLILFPVKLFFFLKSILEVKVGQWSSSEYTVVSEGGCERLCKRLTPMFHVSNKKIKNQFNKNVLSASMSQTLLDAGIQNKHLMFFPTTKSSKHL